MIGQHPLENGKVMGLAAYGKNNDPKNYEVLKEENKNFYS